MGIGDQLRQVYVGIKEEAAKEQSLYGKVLKVLSIVWIVIKELAGIFGQLPYAMRALKEKRQMEDQGRCHLIRYGPTKRNTADVYLPVGIVADLSEMDRVTLNGFNKHEGGRQREAPAGAPVMLFVHGGVWASGDKWNFAPMAARLAESGCVVVVMEYSLFPHATVPVMQAEIETAWEWVLLHIHRFGGDAQKVTVMGHSAGCQLASEMLWRRAHLGLPQPHRFVGLCGPYHISDHYEFETQRGVAAISTMRPAMGGKVGFVRHSPTVTARKPNAKQATDCLPHMILMHSREDDTVPWSQSAAYSHAVSGAGGQCSLLLYSHSSHSDFVTAWWAQGGRRPSDAGQCKEAPKFSQIMGRNGLPPMAADLLSIMESNGDDDIYKKIQEVKYKGMLPDSKVWPVIEEGIVINFDTYEYKPAWY